MFKLENALNRDHNKVTPHKFIKKTFIRLNKSIETCKVGESNKHRNTPIITIVELCNKLDTGVGAAIALINHEENGN